MCSTPFFFFPSWNSNFFYFFLAAFILFSSLTLEMRLSLSLCSVPTSHEQSRLDFFFFWLSQGPLELTSWIDIPTSTYANSNNHLFFHYQTVTQNRRYRLKEDYKQNLCPCKHVIGWFISISSIWEGEKTRKNDQRFPSL